jgi:hypothetical protein
MGGGYTKAFSALQKTAKKSSKRKLPMILTRAEDKERITG